MSPFSLLYLIIIININKKHMIEQTIEQYIKTNNVTEILVGDNNWYALQNMLTVKYRWTDGDTEFWGDEFLNILYDLNVEVKFE